MFSKSNKLLYISIVILTFLYILSFSKSCSNKDKRVELKSSLVNPKYAEEINIIELNDSSSTLILTKQKENFWILNKNISDISYPADSKRIKNLIKNLTNIRKMYKISDDFIKDNSFGLQNSSTFSLKYHFPSGIHELTFGNQDFSLDSRYLMTDKNTVIYEIADDISNFLSTAEQSWAEPYLISQEILGKILPEDIQSATLQEGKQIFRITDTAKLLELRHGGIPEKIDYVEPPAAVITLELGNKSTIYLEIYSQSKENEYTVKTTYKSSSGQQFFYSKISGWTYNKIREITL